MSCECGQDFSPHGSIIGGKNVTPNTYHFLTLVTIHRNKNVISCSGSLINNLYVISSSSCVEVSVHKASYI